MDNRIKKYLHDVHSALLTIDQYLSDQKLIHDYA